MGEIGAHTHGCVPVSTAVFGNCGPREETGALLTNTDKVGSSSKTANSPESSQSARATGLHLPPVNTEVLNASM